MVKLIIDNGSLRIKLEIGHKPLLQTHLGHLMKITLRRLIRLFLLKNNLKKPMLLLSLITIRPPQIRPKPFKIKLPQLELIKSLEKFHSLETLEVGNWFHQALVTLSLKLLVTMRRKTPPQRLKRKKRPKKYQQLTLSQLLSQPRKRLKLQLKTRLRLQLRRKPKPMLLQPKRMPNQRLRQKPPQLN